MGKRAEANKQMNRNVWINLKIIINNYLLIIEKQMMMIIMSMLFVYCPEHTGDPSSSQCIALDWIGFSNTNLGQLGIRL